MIGKGERGWGDVCVCVGGGEVVPYMGMAVNGV